MEQTDSQADRDFKTGKKQPGEGEMASETLLRNLSYDLGHPQGKCLWKEGSLFY